jgi:multiple sugar transport system permease protein
MSLPLAFRRPAPRPRSAARPSWQFTVQGLLFISPWLVGFLVFNIYPIAASFWYSLTNFDLMQPPGWVGLQNYTTMFHDANYWASVDNTLYVMLIGVPLTLILGMFLAILANQKIRGQSIYRTLYFLPSVVPAVATTILFMWVLNPDYGFINSMLGTLHLPQPGWLTSVAWAKPALLLILLWGVGSNMVIFLAGLQGTSPYIYEAARIDGARPWTMFWRLTLPQLSGVILYNLVTSVIGFVTLFTQAYVVGIGTGTNTLGAPAQSTLLYTIYLYQKAFLDLDMGFASAMAWVETIVSVILTVLMFRLYDRFVGLEGGIRQ